MACLAAQSRIDGVADRRGGQRVGQVDEVLLECRAVDPEHAARGGVDADDVIARVDDDDADTEPEEDRLSR